MSVYVDSGRIELGRMLMCHMVADTHRELIEMAARIGVHNDHLQSAGTYREHFDICQSKRALAVKYGAQKISRAQLGQWLYARSASAERGPK